MDEIEGVHHFFASVLGQSLSVHDDAKYDAGEQQVDEYQNQEEQRLLGRLYGETGGRNGPKQVIRQTVESIFGSVADGDALASVFQIRQAVVDHEEMGAGHHDERTVVAED